MSISSSNILSAYKSKNFNISTTVSSSTSTNKDQVDVSVGIVKSSGPVISSSSNVIDLGDRQATVRARFSKPELIIFDNLISQQEADEIIASTQHVLSQSTVVDTLSGQTVKDSIHRSSLGGFVPYSYNDVIRKVERRVNILTNWPLSHGEQFYLINYQKGQEFKSHWDYFYPELPSHDQLIAVGGQRIATLIIYLNAVKSGGNTLLDDLNLELVPQVGMGLYFSYPVPSPSSLTKHGGLPVVEGEKWVLTKWFRQRALV